MARAHRSSPPPGVHVVSGSSATLVSSRPQILFRSMIADNSLGKLAVAPLADPDSSRTVTDLSCSRVYFAGGRGLCLTAAGLISNSSTAKIFDARFHVLRELKLAGIPSRARVSADGRLGATTVFVRGDSYVAAGGFSTRTNIIDLATGRVRVNVEKLPVTRDASASSTGTSTSGA